MTVNDRATGRNPPEEQGDSARMAENVPEGGAPSRRGRTRGIGWFWIPLLLFAVVMVLVPRENLAPDQNPAVGKPSPEIDLVRVSEDEPLELLSGVPAGKVTLLHFWGTWCPPCRMEYPRLAEMAGRFDPEEAFVFLPVSCEGGQGETLESLRSKSEEFFASAGVVSPVFADPRGLTRRSAAERLEHSSLFFPTSILIDSDGQIVGVWEGYTPEAVEQMQAAIERLLEADRPAA